MKKFLMNVLFFILIGVALGEGIIRVFHLSIDVPKMYQDSDKLIKFRPNQTGNYVNGEHKWIINKYGNYGPEPYSLDSVVTVIGDSYISNVMNPPKCHQANFLKNLSPKFNYYPTSRDGASFIEFMEMKKSLHHLNPIFQLLYVHHGDFTESIIELGRKPQKVQVSLETKQIKYAELTSSKIKTLLYNFKFAYFVYRNYIITALDNNIPTNNREESLDNISYKKIDSLIDYSINNYTTENLILVFSPDSDKKVIKMAEDSGFETLFLKADNYKSWQLESDSHWSCKGHKEAALQVSQYLMQKHNSSKVIKKH